MSYQSFVEMKKKSQRLEFVFIFRIFEVCLLGININDDRLNFQSNIDNNKRITGIDPGRKNNTNKPSKQTIDFMDTASVNILKKIIAKNYSKCNVIEILIEIKIEKIIFQLLDSVR